MVRRNLDKETIETLRKLDAVKSVHGNYIQYSDRFRRTAIERDRNGDSPAVIFREAGLDSKIIGYKRIERCMSRWREKDRKEREKAQDDASESVC